MKRRAAFAALVALGDSLLAAAAVNGEAQQSPQLIITARPVCDVFTAPSLTYTLSQTPVAGAPVVVMVNGVGMLGAQELPAGSTIPTDYSIAGNVVTFTGQQTDQMDTPVIKVLYWVAS